MIESLHRRISTLFICLLTVIWLVILFLFINNSYRNNLSDLQQTIRAALHYTTWDTFIISNGQTSPSELDHIPYCLFSIDESNEMEIMFDTFSGVTDDYLLKQGKALISNHKNYVFFKRTYYAVCNLPYILECDILLSPAVKSHVLPVKIPPPGLCLDSFLSLFSAFPGKIHGGKQHSRLIQDYRRP